MSEHSNTTAPETKTGEIVPISEQAKAAIAVPLAGLKFKIKKQVTRTVLQQQEGVPIAVLFQGAAYDGEELTATRGGGQKMQPARLAEILNLETGEYQLLIMNTVLEGELRRNYDGEGYVGKNFVIRGKKREGKSYRIYEIAEIEIDNGEVSGEVVTTGDDPVNKDGEKPGTHKKKTA